MTYVKIEFFPLWVIDSNSPGMSTLGYCLTDDIGYKGAKKRIDWILDERYDATSSNYSFMAKYDNKIFIDFLYADDSDEGSISVPVLAMIDLLEQWDEVCKKNPHEVIIYYENEKFRIEPHFKTEDKK